MKRFKKVRKSWKLDYLKLKLRQTDWALKALLKIHEAQTVEEKSLSASISVNGIGFSKPDAQDLTPLAIKYRKFLDHQEEYAMSIREAKRVCYRMPKYREQILKISDQGILISFMLKDGFIKKDEDGYYHKIGVLNRGI